MNLCTQHHTVLSLERSFSISAAGYLHSSGSVLADSCVKSCTVCVHTFVRIMFYAQRQALNRPLFQHVSARYTRNSRAGYCWPRASEAYGLCRLRAYFCARKLIRARSIRPYRSADRCFKHATKSIVVLDAAWPTLTGFAVCAHTLARATLYAQDHAFYSPNRDSYEVLAAGCARFRKGVGAGVVVLGAGAVSWLSSRLRRAAAALVGCWRRCRCCQPAKHTGAGVS